MKRPRALRASPPAGPVLHPLHQPGRHGDPHYRWAQPPLYPDGAFDERGRGNHDHGLSIRGLRGAIVAAAQQLRVPEGNQLNMTKRVPNLYFCRMRILFACMLQRHPLNHFATNNRMGALSNRLEALRLGHIQPWCGGALTRDRKPNGPGVTAYPTRRGQTLLPEAHTCAMGAVATPHLPRRTKALQGAEKRQLQAFAASC